MDDREKRIVTLMYELQAEMFKRQGEQIGFLRQVAEAALKATDSLEKSHEILSKLIKATGEMIETH